MALQTHGDQCLAKQKKMKRALHEQEEKRESGEKEKGKMTWLGFGEVGGMVRGCCRLVDGPSPSPSRPPALPPAPVDVGGWSAGAKQGGGMAGGCRQHIVYS